LAKRDALPDEYDAHPLTDNLQGYWDCHLEGDLILVYKRSSKKVILAAIGTHTELLRHRKNRGLWGWIFGA
jgi:mRNA interferase YafQ